MRKIKAIRDLNVQEFLSFFRHWKWADIVREQYEKSETKFGTSLLFEQKNGFKFIWYGLVYVLIDYMKEQKFSIQEIVKEIRKVRDSLRLCRDATFHIQPELFSKKFSTEIILDMEENTVSKIHFEIGKSIRADLKRRIAEIPPKVKMFQLFEPTTEKEMLHQLYFLQGRY